MIIGVTGSFGTGKTTVAKMFAAKGAKILDADKLAHLALKKGTPTHKKIVLYFKKEGVLNKDGLVDKRKLAKAVFGNRKKLKRLTGIIQPFVIKKIKDFVRQMGRKGTIVIDAPLLIEAGLHKMVDKLIVVKADRKTQLLRCIKKKNFKKEEVIARIKNQMPLARKMKMADYVIDNNGNLADTKKQVGKIWREIKWI